MRDKLRGTKLDIACIAECRSKIYALEHQEEESSLSPKCPNKIQLLDDSTPIGRRTLELDSTENFEKCFGNYCSI